MFEDLTEQEAMLLLKRSNTAQEDVFTVRRIHVLIFGEMSTPCVLGRLIFWSGRSRLSDGWFYKTAEDLGDETCMSRSTVMRVKEKLEAMGIVKTEVRKVGSTPVLHWKVVAKVLLSLEMNAMEKFESGTDQNSDCLTVTQSTVSPCDSPENKKTTNRVVLTEQSQGGSGGEPRENEKPASVRQQLRKKPTFELPEWVPREQWDAFVEMRKKQRGPFTDYAMKLAVNELQRLVDSGQGTAKEILEQSVYYGWRGVFPKKGESDNGAVRKAVGTDGGGSKGKGKPGSSKYAHLYQGEVQPGGGSGGDQEGNPG